MHFSTQIPLKLFAIKHKNVSFQNYCNCKCLFKSNGLSISKWKLLVQLKIHDAKMENGDLVISHVSPCGVSNSWSSMLIRSVPIFVFICTIMQFSWYLLDNRPSFGIWLYLYHTCAYVHPILSHECEFDSNHSVLL